MKRLLAAAFAGLALAVSAAPALADEPGPLGECLIKNATVEHETIMRTMLLQVLQDQTVAAKETMLTMGLKVVILAQEKCGLKLSDIQKPETEQALGAFGEYLGGKIFTDAMAKVTG